MKVPCHIVPPMVLQHGLLLGKRYFLKFQNHTYATLPKEAERPVGGVLTLSQNPETNVALIQPTNTENGYHLTTDSEKWERFFWMGTKRKKKSEKFRKMVPLKGAFDEF